MFAGMEKAFSTYYGGKSGSGVSQQIINEIRPHDVYLELFLGNGSVYRYKKPATKSVLNDLDSIVCQQWNGSGIAVFNYDAIQFLKYQLWNENLRYCLYLDPPYPISSRREGRERYNCEMTNEQHEELLQVVTSLPGCIDVLISTYENDIYKKCLNDWRLKTFTAKTRQGVATEYLYMNYTNENGILHDYRYLGQDFTDRQRIKRKISCEVEKLKALPAAERNAIIYEVLSSFSIDQPIYARP